MNLDERLGALTHSVELLAGMHKDNEARMQEWIRATDKRLEAADKRMQADEKQIKRLGKYVRSVLAAILDHENRIRAIEGDDDNEADSALA